MYKIKQIKFNDENYPQKLKHIYSPPQDLYVIGNEKILNNKSISIIGCRDCSKYGANTAFEFGYKLAQKGINVISGFARGIDTCAHNGAIHACISKKSKNMGKTIAVLGCRFRYYLSISK